jgi:hypothetical protein
MVGIHGLFSMNWKPAAVRSKRNQRGRLTRKPRTPKMLATQRTASSLRLNAGIAISSTAPTSGVNVMTDRRWSRNKFMLSLPYPALGLPLGSRVARYARLHVKN